jgi:cystathionine beta-lyase
LPDNVYGPSKDAGIRASSQPGESRIASTILCDPQDLADKIGAQDPIWCGWRPPGSVTMEFPDLCRVGADLQGARSVTHAHWTTPGVPGWRSGRSTWTPGAGATAVDLTVHALTKYPSGGGDVLMGSIITQDAATTHAAQTHPHANWHRRSAANDAETVLRSPCPASFCDISAQDHGRAVELARLVRKPGRSSSQVLHPALPDSPGHAFWQRDCAAPRPQTLARVCLPALFSVIVDSRAGTRTEQVDAFCDALAIVQARLQLGGPDQPGRPLRPGAACGGGWPEHLPQAAPWCASPIRPGRRWPTCRPGS